MFFIGIDYKLTKKASKFYRLILLAYKPAIADENELKIVTQMGAEDGSLKKETSRRLWYYGQRDPAVPIRG